MADVIIALDHGSADEALALVDALGDRCDFYKVGLALHTRAGRGIVDALRERGKRIFLDLKFHDIPSTVARAVEGAAAMGVELVTVHAQGGRAMLEAAAGAAGGADGGPRLVAVTLLTSLDTSDVEALWGRPVPSLGDEVGRLAADAAEAGIDGVVASVREVESLKRRHGEGFLVVTPGIRLPGGRTHDQARVATPEEAARAGADHLVVGRAVTAAPDPVAAMERVAEGAARSVREGAR